MRASGLEPSTRVLHPEAFRLALLDKLVEEVAELLEAATAEQQRDELIDVFEVLSELVDGAGLDWVTFEQHAADKRNKRGGFADRIWLENG